MKQPFSENDAVEHLETRTHRHTGRVVEMVTDTIITAQGRQAERDVVLHPGGVCVLPVLPDGRLILIRQFRYPTGEFLLEFPAGKLDVEGEAPEEAIKRELWEETGYESPDWEAHGYFYTAPGFCNERIYAYVARNCTLAATPPGQVDDEMIAPCFVTPAELGALIREQKIQDAKTLALLTLYHHTL